jgi:hypothetical protein
MAKYVIVWTALCELLASIILGGASRGAQADDLLAEIRLLGGSHVGDRVQLKAAGVDVKQVHVAWEFDQRPPTSKAKFAKHTAVETSFDADVPGIYVVRLTVRLRNATRTATLRVTVTDTCSLPPLVAVNTLDVQNGIPGITVGSKFYPEPGNGTGFHVLVLDRNCPDTMYYNYSVPLQGPNIAGMQSDFETLTDGSLVVVALPASAGVIPFDLVGAVNDALGVIGGVLPGKWSLPIADQECWSSNTPVCEGTQWSPNTVTYGSFSVIGVPGMAPGNGWYDDAAQRGTPNGPLVGYLTPGVGVGGGANADAYTFVFGADQYILVDSCVSGGPSACVISVGAQTFAPQTGVNGFHIVVLDRVTLKPLSHQTVSSTQALFEALAPPLSVPLGHFAFNSYNSGTGVFSDRVVVVIQSVGTGSSRMTLPRPCCR